MPPEKPASDFHLAWVVVAALVSALVAGALRCRRCFRKPSAMAALSFLLVGGCGSWAGEKAAPLVQFDSTSKHIGEFPSTIEDLPDAVFTIRNLGSAALFLGPIDASCNGALMELDDDQLLPGATTSLKVRLKQNVRMAVPAVDLRVHTNDPNHRTAR